jgi:hypothetical protein
VHSTRKTVGGYLKENKKTGHPPQLAAGDLTGKGKCGNNLEKSIVRFRKVGYNIKTRIVLL